MLRMGRPRTKLNPVPPPKTRSGEDEPVNNHREELYSPGSCGARA